MSEIPEGAQLSEDGQYWWDGSEWQPVEGGEGGGGEGHQDAEYPEGGRDGEGDGGEGGEAVFDFDGTGIRIDAESSPVPSAGEELKAGFAICNTGTAAGSCVVTFYIDGQDTGVVWESPWLEPGQCTAPDGDGYAHGLPAQEEGRHTFEGWANPPGPGGGGSGTNEVDISAAE